MLDGESRLQLPDRPADLADAAVAAWREPVTIDSYLPESPDRYPAYLDRRVYQGSSGRVYPLPFHDRISPTSVPREWDAVHLENALAAASWCCPSSAGASTSGTTAAPATTSSTATR